MSNFREIVPEQQQVITSWIRVQLADLEEVDFIWPFTGMAASASEKRVFPRPSSSWGSPILEIVSRRSKLLLLLSLPRDLSFKLGRSCGVKNYTWQLKMKMRMCFNIYSYMKKRNHEIMNPKHGLLAAKARPKVRRTGPWKMVCATILCHVRPIWEEKAHSLLF